MKQDISIVHDGTAFEAYLSAPDGDGPFPALIVIEEIWGMNGHIRSVCDRFAHEGFFVLSPELIGSGVLAAISPDNAKEMQDADEEQRHAAQARMREATAPTRTPEFARATVEKLKLCIDQLLADKRVNGKIGVVGFCFGGTYAFELGIEDSRVRAIIPFYGRAPEPLERIRDIRAPILAFYGEQDARLVSKLPELADAMERYDRDFSYMAYPQCGHAFFNDTNARAYNEDAARDAWEKTLPFLRANLT